MDKISPRWKDRKSSPAWRNQVLQFWHTYVSKCTLTQTVCSHQGIGLSRLLDMRAHIHVCTSEYCSVWALFFFFLTKDKHPLTSELLGGMSLHKLCCSHACSYGVQRKFPTQNWRLTTWNACIQFQAARFITKDYLESLVASGQMLKIISTSLHSKTATAGWTWLRTVPDSPENWYQHCHLSNLSARGIRCKTIQQQH